MAIRCQLAWQEVVLKKTSRKEKKTTTHRHSAYRHWVVSVGIPALQTDHRKQSAPPEHVGELQRVFSKLSWEQKSE
jgi:hypothetical protein